MHVYEQCCSAQLVLLKFVQGHVATANSGNSTFSVQHSSAGTDMCTPHAVTVDAR